MRVKFTSFAVGSDAGLREDGSQGHYTKNAGEEGRVGGDDVRERQGVCGGVCRPNADSCRPWRGLYFLSVMGALGGFCAEEGCDLACVLTETLVAECRTNFREAEME